MSVSPFFRVSGFISMSCCSPALGRNKNRFCFRSQIQLLFLSPEGKECLLANSLLNARVPADRYSARVQCLAPQRIAHLLFEAFGFGSLLNHGSSAKPDSV